MTGPMAAGPEERASESIARLRSRFDAAVCDLRRLLDDIEATAERLAKEKGRAGDGR